MNVRSNAWHACMVTCVYNEGLRVARWVEHCARLGVPPDNIFVVDHGSTDGSTVDLNANVIPWDAERRFAGIDVTHKRFEFLNALLLDFQNYFDVVAYADCDELIAPDPRIAETLVDFARDRDTNAAIGYDVLHEFSHEGPLESGPVSLQRRKLLLVASMCKTVIARRGEALQWTRGFHYATQPARFGGLNLFHLRYADLSEGLSRLDLTRSFRDAGGIRDHQSIDQETYRGWLTQWCSYPVVEGDIDASNERVASFLAALTPTLGQDEMYAFDYSARAHFLLEIPARFQGLF